jgi:hypothetical protein
MTIVPPKVSFIDEPESVYFSFEFANLAQIP